MKKLIINIKGKTTDDLILALEEVQKKIEEGYVQGHNSNEDGRYAFDISEEE